MLKKLTQNILISVAIGSSTTVLAAETCESSTECIKGVSLFAPVDALFKRCSDLNPGSSEAYHEVLSRVSPNLTPEILEMMRTSAIYAKISNQTNAQLDKLSKTKLQEACDNAIKPQK